MKNHFTNLSSLQTFDETGPVDYLDKLDAFEEAYAAVESDAGFILVDNFQDRSFRSALNLAGWKPQGDPQAQAIEWYEMDYEYANTPVSDSIQGDVWLANEPLKTLDGPFDNPLGTH